MELCQAVIVPDWLYWLLPRACLAAGLIGLLVLDGWETIPAWLATWYGWAMLVIRGLILGK